MGTQAAKGRAKLEARVARESFPLDYSTTLRAVRDALLAVSPAPVVCCEGANTMDNARCAACGSTTRSLILPWPCPDILNHPMAALSDCNSSP